MNKYETIKSKTYTVKSFQNKELSNIIENLSFDDAYKKAVPEEALGQYPGNYWHVKMKYSVIEDLFNNDIISVLVSYIEDPKTSIRVKEFYIFK